MIKVSELVKVFQPKKVIINEIKDEDTPPNTIFEGTPQQISPVNMIRTVVPLEYPTADYDTIKQVLWIWLPAEGRKG